jgi:hypothetical protein
MLNMMEVVMAKLDSNRIQPFTNGLQPWPKKSIMKVCKWKPLAIFSLKLTRLKNRTRSRKQEKAQPRKQEKAQPQIYKQEKAQPRKQEKSQPLKPEKRQPQTQLQKQTQR